MGDSLDIEVSARDRARPDGISEAFLAALRDHGVVPARLFGSVARNEERTDSDLDLLVEFREECSYGERFRLAEELSRPCGRQVELVTHLHPACAPYILPTLVTIEL